MLDFEHVLSMLESLFRRLILFMIMIFVQDSYLFRYSKLEQTVEGPDSDVMHQQPSQPVSVN